MARTSGDNLAGSRGAYQEAYPICIPRGRPDRRKVVIIEIDEGNELLEPIRQTGAVLLIGDGTDRLLLAEAGVGRAAALIAVTGDDGANAEVAVRANAILSPLDRDPLHCVIHIVDPGMWDLLRESEFDDGRFPSLRLDVFNLNQRAAELILEEYEIIPSDASRPPDPLAVLVIGLGDLGKQLILKSAEVWYRGRKNKEQRMRITALDRRATSILSQLAARFPQLENAAYIHAIDLEINSPAFARGDFLSQAQPAPSNLLAFICLDDDSLVLSTTLSLRRVLRGSRAKIILRMREAEGLSRLVQATSLWASDLPSLAPFAPIDRTCGPDLLKEGTHERLARALHETYLRSVPKYAQGGGAPQHWSRLSEEMREANRRQADHIGAMQTHAGCALELPGLLHQAGYRVIRRAGD